MTVPKAWMSWSSGKDSAFALHQVQTAGQIEVVGLLTTVNATADRVAMHAVRRVLLDAQARAAQLPVHTVELPWPCPNEEYERLMSRAVEQATAEGVTLMIFGDLFLADVRAYRENALAGTGISAVFPLWHRPTPDLAREMIEIGQRAVLTCVDPAQAPRGLAGRWYDEDLLADLPDTVDPCGEHGEFHTFVVDAPVFAHPLDVVVGETIERDGFVFTDVLPCSQ